jgi:signal transduction histidine kinase
VSLRARLLGAVSYVLLLAIVAFGVPLGLSLSARVNAEVRTQAQAQADLVAAAAADLLGPASRRQLDTLIRSGASSLLGRVLIVNRSGRVVVDSAGPAEVGTSYLSRPEIGGALAGRQTQVQRASTTLGREILATAVPIIHGGRTVGAVRVTQSISAVHRAVLRVELAIALTALVVLALGLLAGTLLAAQIARPLRRLETIARRVAQGDLRALAKVEGTREQRSLSNSFNDMTARMARLLSAQQDFVADASHQLRTPLTGLRLRLEEARALSDRPQARAELDAALAELDRLSHTVDELLLLSRAGERSPVGTSVYLRELAEDAVRRWQPGASGRGIALAHRPEGDAGTVWAARADLERGLDALLENALRYSPSGSTVTVATRPGRIEVRDRGPGVPADERETVFERFRRGSAGMSDSSGHGLGLAIARELAREWGCEVTIQGREGGGTSAILEIDRDRSAAGGGQPRLAHA